LKCRHKDPEDEKYYEKLALQIEEHKYEKLALQIEEHKFEKPSFDRWLVAYARDPKTFPQYFLDQFELVSLDSKDYEVKQDEGKKTEKRKGEEKKLRGIKKHYIPEKEKSKIIKDIIKTHPKESNTFIARKAMLEIEKDYRKRPDGNPFYTEKTLAKEVSKLRNKKKRKKMG
jgi:hypothetical protein